MQAGKILVAQHLGTFVIKLAGDVRLTLSATIDEYFQDMFSRADFMGVIVDLSDAEGIDSTSLGLLAKLAIQAKKNHHLVPILMSPNPNISRLLDSMGFNKVFDIDHSVADPIFDEIGGKCLDELPVVCADEACVRSKVIEAHRVLMGMNAKNEQAFSALVTTLETQ